MGRAHRGARIREGQALLTQARYLAYDWEPSERVGNGPHVVLLHGLYASAGVWRPLRKSLHARMGAHTHSFSYAPGPGVIELSARLARLLKSIEGARPIHLVGHSLGGLVQRYCASQGARDERIIQTISLAAPFSGSQNSWLVPGQAGRDIQKNSGILEQLCKNSPQNRAVPHLSLSAEEDVLIHSSPFPEFGAQEQIKRVGHNGILFSDAMMERVVRQIALCE